MNSKLGLLRNIFKGHNYFYTLVWWSLRGNLDLASMLFMDAHLMCWVFLFYNSMFFRVYSSTEYFNTCWDLLYDQHIPGQVRRIDWSDFQTINLFEPSFFNKCHGIIFIIKLTYGLWRNNGLIADITFTRIKT